MSCYLEIANFLKNEAAGDEKLKDEFGKLEKEIISYKNLPERKDALLMEEFQLKVERRKLETLMEETKEIREKNDSFNNNISELYDSFIKLNSEMRSNDLNKAVGYDILVQEMKWKDEKKEMEQMISAKNEIRENCENRNIVQKFRRTQIEYQEALTGMKQVEEIWKTNLNEAETMLTTAREQRNQIIIRLVQDAKKLEIMHREKLNATNQNNLLKKLKEKKLELMAKLQPKNNIIEISNANAIQNKQRLESAIAPETTTAFDLRNPLAFFKSLKLDIHIDQIMGEFSLDLQKKELKKSADNETELRSILKYKTDTKDNAESIEIENTTHHVHFLEQFSTSSNSSLSLSQDNLNNDFQNDFNKDKSIDESINENKIIDLLTPTEEVIDKNHETSSEVSLVEATGAQVIENKMVKPAGTPLPKSIPFTISPPSSITDDEIIPEKQKPITAVTPSTKIFKVPKVPKSTSTTKLKTSTTKLKTGSKKQTIDTNEVLPMEQNISSDTEQSMKTKEKELTFDSLFLSNRSPSNSSDDGLDFNTRKDSTDSNSFNFESNDENINIEMPGDDIIFDFVSCNSEENDESIGRYSFEL